APHEMELGPSKLQPSVAKESAGLAADPESTLDADPDCGTANRECLPDRLIPRYWRIAASRAPLGICANGYARCPMNHSLRFLAKLRSSSLSFRASISDSSAAADTPGSFLGFCSGNVV